MQSSNFLSFRTKVSIFSSLSASIMHLQSYIDYKFVKSAEVVQIPTPALPVPFQTRLARMNSILPADICRDEPQPAFSLLLLSTPEIA